MNLTPDENTGMGIWTEDMFVDAMKTGKHMGTSRTIQPPMPWPWYGDSSVARALHSRHVLAIVERPAPLAQSMIWFRWWT